MHVTQKVNIREVALTGSRPVFAQKMLKISFLLGFLVERCWRLDVTLKTISNLSLCLTMVSFNVLDLPSCMLLTNSLTLLGENKI